MKIPALSVSLPGAGLFFLAFAVATAFVPWFVDTATVPRWCVMALGAPFLLMLASSEIPAPTNGLGTVALCAIMVSLLWTVDVLTGMDDLAHWLILAVVFCLGAAYEDLTPAWRGLSVGVTISALIALAQRFGWDGLPQSAVPGGLFANRNILAEAAVLALVTQRGKLLWSIGPAIAIVLAGSRNAFGALLVMAGLLLWYRNRPLALLLIASTGLAGLTMFAVQAPGALERLEVYETTLANLTWWGGGVGSFAATYQYFEHAHSDALQLVYEHGLLALPMFILLWTLWSPTDDEPANLAITAVVLLGVVAFPLHMPLTAFCLALAAGHAPRLWEHVRAREFSRAVADRGAPGRGQDFRAGGVAQA